MDLTLQNVSTAPSRLYPPRDASPARAVPGPDREGDGPVPAGADALSELAPLFRVRPEVQSLLSLDNAWKCDHRGEDDSSVRFLIVTRGTCTVDLAGAARALPLSEGDVIVLPPGAPHVLRLPSAAASAVPLYGGESATSVDAQTELLRGRLTFEHAHPGLVASALSDAIVVATADGSDAMRMRRLIAAIKDEIECGRAGSDAIANDLASALFVMILRVHLERQRTNGGLLGLLAHRQAGRALDAMLQDPARPWTLDALAACAHASRASLVRMFKKLAHAAPLEFLATLRLELARRKLATSRQPLGDIAADVGYQSESAFSRAFRRRFGITPGQARVCPATPFQPCQSHRHADGRHLALVRTGTMHASSFGERPV